VTEEEDFVDLVWHECEFRENYSFSYAVYDAVGGYLGCCYLYPVGRRTPLSPELAECDVDVSWWVTPDAYDRGYYAKLYAALGRWVAEQSRSTASITPTPKSPPGKRPGQCTREAGPARPTAATASHASAGNIQSDCSIPDGAVTSCTVATLLLSDRSHLAASTWSPRVEDEPGSPAMHTCRAGLLPTAAAWASLPVNTLAQ
jgi:hypothetical protein